MKSTSHFYPATFVVKSFSVKVSILSNRRRKVNPAECDVQNESQLAVAFPSLSGPASFSKSPYKERGEGLGRAPQRGDKTACDDETEQIRAQTQTEQTAECCCSLSGTSFWDTPPSSSLHSSPSSSPSLSTCPSVCPSCCWT